jgi:hypothetical protein
MYTTMTGENMFKLCLSAKVRGSTTAEDAKEAREAEMWTDYAGRDKRNSSTEGVADLPSDYRIKRDRSAQRKQNHEATGYYPG